MPITAKSYAASVTTDTDKLFQGDEPADSYQLSIELKINDFLLSSDLCNRIVKEFMAALLVKSDNFKNFSINTTEIEVETTNEREERVTGEAKAIYDELDEDYIVDTHEFTDFREFVIAKQKEKPWYSRLSGMKLNKFNELLEGEPLTKADFE